MKRFRAFCKLNQINEGDTIVCEFIKQWVTQVHIYRGKECVVLLEAPNEQELKLAHSSCGTWLQYSLVHSKKMMLLY